MKIGTSWIRHVKGCWKGFRWEAICFSSITQAGFSAMVKAVISAEINGILERLGSSVESWQARLEKLRSGRLLGRFFAASRER